MFTIFLFVVIVSLVYIFGEYYLGKALDFVFEALVPGYAE